MSGTTANNHSYDTQEKEAIIDSNKLQRATSSDFEDSHHDLTITSKDLNSHSQGRTWLIVISLQLAVILVSIDKCVHNNPIYRNHMM